MTPSTADLMVGEVVPRLRAAARSVPKIGHEDDEEIVQDATLMAGRMLVSAEAKGRRLSAGNVCHYALRAARSGRRSQYSGRGDVMSPGCQLDGRAHPLSLDQKVECDDGGVASLHEVFAAGSATAGGDPALEAARNLDWEEFLAGQPERHRIAIEVLAGGGTMREAGRRCGVGDSAALRMKRRIAADLTAFLGAELVRRLLGGLRPAWEAQLRATRAHHGICGAHRKDEPR